MASSNEAIADFFDREACCAQARPHAKGLSRVSARLLAKIDELGLDGSSVLDVGCGPGHLSLALAGRGAGAVTGLDLSPAAVAAAEGGRPEHLADRVRFAVSDAATAPLGEHDVVVLNKVVCCYPDAHRLLGNTVPAARRLLAISLPASRGLRGLLARLILWGENLWRRLRNDPFRAYVHTLGLEGYGARLLWTDHVGVWRLELYETDPEG